MVKQKTYGVLYRVRKAGNFANRNLIVPAVDLGEALKKGVIRGYYDAQGIYKDPKKFAKDIANERDITRILRNCIVISLTTPVPGAGAFYLVYRGRALLFQRNDKAKTEQEKAKDSKLDEL